MTSSNTTRLAEPWHLELEHTLYITNGGSSGGVMVKEGSGWVGVCLSNKN
ncbi:hemolysin secretion/activation ShlB/FhaC/HecB family protein [Sesbania bispinosa]|nr:hemolysin secretion/activation ShlB/FhaC/HecB family protein [Sesbania bispinosa]